MNENALLPADDLHNQRLLQHVRPPGWVNPVPQGRYQLVVIGGGTAGLVSAAAAAGLGARVALIESGFMGGDCLVSGCVPSKALLAAARCAAAVHNAAQYGVRISGSVQVDFAAVMERLRRIRAEISPHDSAARFKSLGVDVFFAKACFSGPRSISADGVRLDFSRAIIAAGSRPTIPPIPGLALTGCLTSDSLFNLTQLPPRLTVIGGGPIGVEMAQAFAACGSRVTLVEAGPRLLPRDDPEAAALLQNRLSQQHGVRILLNTKVTAAERRGPDRILTLETAITPPTELACDEILAAVGRTPRLDGLNPDAAGIRTDSKHGVLVNDRLQTSNPAVFAAGDVCSDWKFTHAADFMARLAIRNSLFAGRARLSQLLVPWCTWTSPEIAHVGITSETAASDPSIQTLTQPFSSNDRALLDGHSEGFVRLYLRKGSDRILGATIVGEHAGELICEITVAMSAGLGLKRLASVIHPYPCTADAIRRLGDTYNRNRLTPTVKRLLATWLKWRF